MKSLLLTMSLSGTTVYLIYMFLRPILNQFCSVRWRYGMLKLALFFFIFPAPWFKYNLLNIILLFSPMFRIPTLNDIPFQIDTTNSMAIVGRTIFFSRNTSVILGVTLILLTVTLFSIVVQIQKNRKLRHNFERYALQSIGKHKLQIMTEEVSAEVVMRQKVQFGESEYIETPMVIGLFRPLVLFPQKCQEQLTDKSQRMILRHELLHIKHKDLWFKFLGIVVISLHWYNPVSWLLFYEICCISEIYCDEEVACAYEGKNWKEYAELVILLSTDIGSERIYGNTLYTSVSMIGSTKRVTKRRIKAMKRQKSKYSKNLLRLVSCIFSVFICISATVTTFAYEPAIIAVSDENEDGADFIASDVWFYPEGIDIPREAESLPYEYYFVDESGNIKEIIGNSHERASCVHSYVPGKITEHLKNNKGGCKVSIYNVKRCSLCGKLQKLNCESTDTYMPCPH